MHWLFIAVRLLPGPIKSIYIKTCQLPRSKPPPTERPSMDLKVRYVVPAVTWASGISERMDADFIVERLSECT